MTGRFELNTRTVGALLKSDALRSALSETVTEIANRAGDGYGHDTKTMGTRVIASVYTMDAETANQDAETNDLLKAVF